MPYKDPEKRKEYQRKRRQTKKEQEYQKEYQKRYRQSGKGKEATRKYIEKNPEKYRETQSKWRRGNEKYLAKKRAKYQENKDKSVARYTLKNAVSSGLIERLPCEVCGSKKSEGHHDDYSKPLEVRWLCRRHHQEAHDGNFSNPQPAKKTA